MYQRYSKEEEHVSDEMFRNSKIGRHVYLDPILCFRTCTVNCWIEELNLESRLELFEALISVEGWMPLC